MSQIEILQAIITERGRQDLIWGEQNHPLKPTKDSQTRYFQEKADKAKKLCDDAANCGTLTWFHIYKEEFYEIFAEDDPSKQMKELIQHLAVGVAMAEYLQRRFKISCEEPRSDV